MGNLTLGGVQLKTLAFSLSQTGVIGLTGYLSCSEGAEFVGAFRTLVISAWTPPVPNFQLGVFHLTAASVTLTSTGLSYTGTTTLPLVNSVTLTGTIQDVTSDYSMSINLGTHSIGAYSLANTVVTLNENGVGITGVATNSPLVGNNVPISGTILDSSHYSLSAQIGTVTIGTFTLTSADFILSDAGLTPG